MPVRPIVVIALVLVAAGCGSERRQSTWGGQVDTLPSGALHVRNPASGTWNSASAWRLVEDLRIGSEDGEGPDVFGAQLLLAVDDDGRIFVLDRQSFEVRVFDRDGEHVRTFGREGEGPGEFRRPNGMRIDGEGRVWVVDPGLARYSVFDTAGQFTRTHPRQVASFGFIWGGEVDAEGRLIEQDFSSRDGQSVILYIRYTSDVQPADTLVLPPSAPPEVWELTSGTSRMMMMVPFSPGPAAFVDPSGHVWSGRTDSYRLAKLDMTGDTVLVVERAHERLPITPGERARAMEQVTSGLPPGATVDASKVPAQKPVFEAIHGDSEGNLWVRILTHDDTTSTTFDVFDERGFYLGQVSAPVALARFQRPVITRDAMYVVATDELDVPYVVRLRIDRSGRATP